jgi:hypothetical protein
MCSMYDDKLHESVGRSHILLSAEEDGEKLRGNNLVDLLKRSYGQKGLPEPLRQFLINDAVAVEKAKRNVALCPTLTVTGDCKVRRHLKC